MLSKKSNIEQISDEYKYYSRFEKDFLDFFNTEYNTSENNFVMAVLLFLNHIYYDVTTFGKKKVIELQGLCDNLNEDEKSAIDRIKNDIEKGNNLKKYMSKGTEKILNLDTLKNSWGIHHFHLGKDKGKEFVERSSKLLFVYFRDGNVYMICVMEHPKNEKWGSVKPVRILYKNYPELFEKYILRDAKNVEPKITDDSDYEKLFKLGMTTVIELEPGVYSLPFNMGVNSMGFSKSGVSSGVNLKILAYKGRFCNETIVYFGPKEMYKNYRFSHCEGFLKIEAFLNPPYVKEKEIYFWDYKKLKLLDEGYKIINT